LTKIDDNYRILVFEHACKDDAVMKKLIDVKIFTKAIMKKLIDQCKKFKYLH